jgi:nicotinamidase/pyrazinamidase
MRIEMLLIDPQNDFCSPELKPDGKLRATLKVDGAEDDMFRLAQLLESIAGSRNLGDVHVTLDTHHLLHIANPAYWVDKDLKHPDPYTVITVDDVVSGRWRARYSQMQAWALDYVKALAAKGRYPLCIWPPHCLIGHWGTQVYDPIRQALDQIEAVSPNVPLIDYVTKGSNFQTEHYGAVMAEVQDPGDPSTGLNVALIESLKNADKILVAGEALSHCVANTVRDIAANFGEDNVKKMVLIDGCASPVTGFEQLAKDFVTEMTGRGMQVMSIADVQMTFI